MEPTRKVTLEETQRIIYNLEENLSNAQFRKLAENLNVISKACGIETFSVILKESGVMTISNSSEHIWSGTSHRELIRLFLRNVWRRHRDANIDNLIHACITTQLNWVAEVIAEACSISKSAPITLEKMLPKKWMYVGKISYDPAKVLGKGANNTIVYTGKFENMREIAVKKIFIDFVEFEKVQNEIDLLVKHGCDGHENVITYIGHEIIKGDQPTFLIALELCQYSLYDWIQQSNIVESEIRGYITTTDILRQATDGLVHLHSHNIIHRDIKPENIMLKVVVKTVVVKITDFGISRKIPDGKRSITNYTGSGSDGWMAPEVLRLRLKGVESIKLTRQSDIFSLGCIFFYTWSGGHHYFGEPFLRNANIVQNKVDQSSISAPTWSQILPGSRDLIAVMTLPSPSERPNALDVSKYPIFWSSETKLKFLITVSDLTLSNQNDQDVKTFLEIFENLPLCNLTSAEFSSFPAISSSSRGFNNFNSDWSNLICEELKLKLIASKRYKSLGKSLRQILRVIRNLHNHFWDQDDEVRHLLGNPPDSFLEYWLSRFPNLIYVIWNLLLNTWSHPALSEFFTSYTSYSNNYNVAESEASASIDFIMFVCPSVRKHDNSRMG